MLFDSRRYSVFSALTLLLVCLVTFVFGELLVRVARPQLTYSKLLLMTGEQYAEGEFIPFTLRKNYVAQSPSMEFPGKMVTISINSLGLRGPETTVAKRPNTKRILFLGYSYTFGVYCNDDEIYARILERLYTSQTPGVEVLNAGYADGWSTDEHYAWLLNRGLSFRPDLVVYGFFIGYDIDDINTKQWVSLDKRGLPTRIVNPDIYIDEVGRIRSRITDSRTVGSEVIFKVPLLRESHLFVFLNRAVVRLGRSVNSRLHLSQSTHHTILNNGWGDTPFNPILSPQLSETTMSKLQVFFRLVQGMQEASREVGAEFLLLMIPVNFQVEPEFLKVLLDSDNFRIRRDPFQEMEPRLKDMEIQYLNLLEAMKRHPEQKFFPRNGEVHFSPNGHHFAAEVLKRKLDELGWP
jgi:hypothetical protein